MQAEHTIRGLSDVTPLFAKISPDGGAASLREASRVVVERLLERPAPRALCELRIGDDDYIWLRRWAQALENRLARRCLDPLWSRGLIDSRSAVSEYQAAGALFLLLFAEVARREAREGYVWSTVHECFAPRTRSSLFAAGQPKEGLKDALEAACRGLHLRHVFGQEGTQSYYVSVYLQFGFTRRGIVRLPFWLSGHGQSEAIGWLLQPTTGSVSFQRLWTTLRDYRRKNVVEEHARRVIADSPWVLPSWADELLQQALQRLDLGTADTAASGDVGGEIPFLDEPRLAWMPPRPPHFTSRIVNLAAFDLSADSYDIVVGSETVGRLLEQPDGTYAVPEQIVLPIIGARQSASLVEVNGRTPVATQELVLWDAQSDVTVYEHAAGRRLDAWRDAMAPARAYVLLAAADLELWPAQQQTQWYRTTDGAWQFRELQAGWSPETRLLLDTQVLWTPHIGTGKRTLSGEPAWAAGIKIYGGQSHPLRLGETLEPLVTGLGTEIRLTFVRRGAQPIGFNQVGSKAMLDPVPLTPEIAADDFIFTLGVQRGNEFARIRRALSLEMRGAALLGPTGWTALTPDTVLTVQQAASQLCRLYFGREDVHDTGELALMEGTTFSRRVGAAPRPLGRLAGLGAPLQIRRGPYNADRAVLTLARSVIDPGLIRSVIPSDSGIDLHMTYGIEPGCDHTIIAWPLSSTPEMVAGEHIEVLSPTCWRVPLDSCRFDELVVGLAYRGVRQGTWWPEQPEENALERAVMEGLSPLIAAALARWMHLPLIGETYRATIRRLAHTFPAEALDAWLHDEGLPYGLQPDARSEEWISAVRHVFMTWTPAPGQARDVIAMLSRDEQDGDRLGAATRGLLRIDPLLMRRVVYRWLETAVLPGDGRAAAIAQVQALRRAAANLPADASASRLDARRRELLEQAASVMQVDQRFLTEGIVKRAVANMLEKVDRLNLYVAMGVAGYNHREPW